MANGTNKPVRTPYEKGWWYLFTALVVCVVVFPMAMTTAHGDQPVAMAWFYLIFIMSALLGLYSLVLLKRLPVTMTIVGIIQGCLFGFSFGGRFLFAWIAMMTT